MSALVGWRAFLLVHVPVTMVSCTIGVWLFYVQHQFEPTYWEHDDRWQFEAAAVHGSSYYVLPPLLQWLTGNIGLHHVHHLSARIPNYRLQTVVDRFPELNQVTRITLWDSLRCVSLALVGRGRAAPRAVPARVGAASCGNALAFFPSTTRKKPQPPGNRADPATRAWPLGGLAWWPTSEPAPGFGRADPDARPSRVTETS